MRRNGLLVGGWALATLFALVLGLQGIHSVSTSVTNPRPAPLSPASVKAALQRTNAAATSSASSASSASDASSDDPKASTGASHAGADDGSVVDESTTFSFGPLPSPASNRDGQAPSSNAPPPSSSSSNDRGDTRSSDGSNDPQSSSSATTTTTAPAAQDKTYQLVGGSVGVRFQNGGAYLLWATPNNGYSVENNSGGGEVEVRFDNGHHESRLRAWWDNGPQQEIDEGGSGGD